MVDLNSFFESHDIPALRERGIAEHGIDIQGVYCLATGKQIGSFDESEIAHAITEIGLEDDESILDDLIVRVVASMRPSPAMNKPDHFTIREMLIHRPVDVMALLVNRLNGSRRLLTERDGESSFQPLFDRIATWTQINKLAASGLALTAWTHYLLELDAKMNLHDIDAPLIERDRKGQWILSRHGQPLFQLLDESNHEKLFHVFESWAHQQLDLFDERDRRMTREANWIRGNVHTKAAFRRTYLENPEIANRRHAEKRAAKDKKKSKVGRKPLSQKAIKLNEENNQFLHLLEGILDGTIEVAKPEQPAKPRVLTGGTLKLNLNLVKRSA